MSEKVTLYGTVWCGHCNRLSRQLRDAGITFEVVDIEREPAYGDRIQAHTGGYRTVPTLQIGDLLLVNPSLPEVERALAT